MTFRQKPAAIHFDGAETSRVIEAEHHVRSECGHWVTVWEVHEGSSDMKIPRERIVMIEPRETERDTSESKQETPREVKA